MSARVGVLALISMAVAINYLDRAVLGIAAPSIQQQFGLSPAVMGVVFSAFSWTYFLGQVPSGVLLDRFGTRAIYSLSLLGWSLATLLHAAATGFGSLLGLRLALGLAEAPCFPANSSVVAKWFPRSERGRAIGVYTAAEYVGLSFMSPVLFWILNRFGWRALFGAAGGIGVAAALVFAQAVSRPGRSSNREPSRTGARGRRRGRCGQDGAGRVRPEPDSRTVPPSTDVGALHRTVRGLLDVRLLPHVVPDVPRHRAAHGLDPRRHLHGPAVHRGVLRHPVRRLVVGPDARRRRRP